MNGDWSRRDFLQLAAAASVGPMLGLRSRDLIAAPTNIVVACFAGVWQDGLKAGAIPCYKGKNGGDVSIVIGSPSDFTQKIMATRDKPVLDVIAGTDGDLFQNAQLGIIEKIDPAKIPNLGELVPIFTEPYEGWGFGFDGGRDGLAVNTNKIKEVPKSWIELTEQVVKGKYGRSVIYPHLTNSDGIAVTWLINRELGGTLDNPEPAIKRLREMKPYITKFYVSNAEPGTALTSGEADIAIWTDGRTNGIRDAGNAHIQYFQPTPGSPMLNICMMKVKNGSPAAWEYLNCAASATSQEAFNKFFPGYYASNRNVQYPPGSREKQDPSSLDRSFKNWIQVPWKELAKVRPMWMEAWTRALGA